MIRHMRLADAVPVQGSPVRPPYDLTAFLGVWINVNPHTTGIARLDVSSTDQGLRLTTHALGHNGMISWGAVEDITPFASSSTSTKAAGFEATYDFGFVEVRLQGNLNKGLLVLASYSRFKDGSGRVNYFTREYFSSVASDRYAPGAAGPQET